MAGSALGALSAEACKVFSGSLVLGPLLTAVVGLCSDMDSTWPCELMEGVKRNNILKKIIYQTWMKRHQNLTRKNSAQKVYE